MNNISTKTYKRDNTNSALLTGVAILLSLLGIIALWFVYIKMENAPEVANLRYTPFLFLLSAAGCFYLAKRQSSAKSFKLSETAITVISRTGDEKIIPLKDIEDTVYYYFGKGYGILHLGFRKTSSAEWHLIGPGIKSHGELIARFRKAHIANRLPVVLKDVASHKDIQFRLRSDFDAAKYRIAGVNAQSMLQAYTNTILVNDQRILLNGQTLPLNNVQIVTMTAGNDIVLYNKSGQEYATVSASNISNPDIFVEVVSACIG